MINDAVEEKKLRMLWYDFMIYKESVLWWKVGTETHKMSKEKRKKTGTS